MNFFASANEMNFFAVEPAAECPSDIIFGHNTGTVMDDKIVHCALQARFLVPSASLPAGEVRTSDE